MELKRGPALLAAIAAVAVVLFLVLKGGGEESEPASGGGPSTPQGQRAAVPTIVVEDGQPVGGVHELEFEQGERIRFRVRSDVADEVHMHGYDVAMDVAAGGEAKFDVPATIEGVFEVELEERVVPLAEITVNPG